MTLTAKRLRFIANRRGLLTSYLIINYLISFNCKIIPQIEKTFSSRITFLKKILLFKCFDMKNDKVAFFGKSNFPKYLFIVLKFSKQKFMEINFTQSRSFPPTTTTHLLSIPPTIMLLS